MITAIIFDFGGVLSSPDPAWDAEVESQFGLPARTWAPQLVGSTGVETAIGGKPYTSEDMVVELANRLEPLLGDRSLEAASVMCQVFTNERAFPPNRAVVELFHELHATGLRTGILSNGPSDMEATMLGPLIASGSIDALVLSGRDGIGKPSAAAFRRILDELAVLPNEALLVDDTQGHLDAAAELGIRGVFFEGDPVGLRRSLREFGVPC